MKKTKKHELIDARQMAAKHPDTFQVPTATEIDNIMIGWLCKVATSEERFWVLVTEKKPIGEISGEYSFKGKIENEVDTQGLKFGDEIEFYSCNIYEIDDDLPF